MADVSEIQEHAEVIGADGVHVGTVDKVEGDRIKLTKSDSNAEIEGVEIEGEHHYLSLGLVAAVEEDGTVRLSATGANAVALEEDEDD
jgi:hypothetical protein